MNKIGNKRKETEGQKRKKRKKGTIDKKRWEMKGRREGRDIKKRKKNKRNLEKENM